MLRDSTVVRLRQPDAIDDPVTELAREGARRMLATVMVAEAGRASRSVPPRCRNIPVVSALGSTTSPI